MRRRWCFRGLVTGRLRMLLDKNAQDALAQAINAQEKRTDAELVTVLARQADTYRYVTLLLALMHI